MTPKRAIAKCRSRFRLERQERRGEIYWMVLDNTNSGSGRPGTEAQGRAEYEKVITFRALELMDAEYDWHAHDWHLLTGSAETRVAQMLIWRADYEKASAERDGILALVGLMCGRISMKGDGRQ